MFDIDLGHFTELGNTVASFLVPNIFPYHFMVEKCVHFDIWNKKISKISKGPPMIWHIFEIFSQIQILKNEPNHIGGPFEIFEKIFIPNIKMYRFFHHKNDGEKCLGPKMKPQ